MIYFHDFLLLADSDWKIKPLIKAINAFPSRRGFGCFGPKVTGQNPMPKVKAIIAECQPLMFRLQLIYTQSHKLPSEKYMREEIPRWQDLAALNPQLPHFLSPCCEYEEEERNKVYDVMSLATELAPNCGIVQSPGRLKDGRVAPTFPDWDVEEHGNRARTGCTFFSSDGESSFDQCDKQDLNLSIRDTQKRLQNGGCKYFGVWGARYNLREADNEYDSQHRVAAPEPAYVTGVDWLIRERVTPPNPRFSYIAPQKPRLLKTFAEDHQGPESRENNPCYMTPKRKKPLKFVDMVTWDNQRVARFPLYSDDNPNRKTDRYYFDKKYAWQLAQKAIDLSGSPFVAMKEGELTYVWPFHAAERDPFFQVPRP